MISVHWKCSVWGCSVVQVIYLKTAMRVTEQENEQKKKLLVRKKLGWKDAEDK